MKHGPCSYHSPGRVHPRDGLRVFYGRRVRRQPAALPTFPVVVVVTPMTVDERYPAGTDTGGRIVAGIDTGTNVVTGVVLGVSVSVGRSPN